jgi:hypothetical protein
VASINGGGPRIFFLSRQDVYRLIDLVAATMFRKTDLKEKEEIFEK